MYSQLSNSFQWSMLNNKGQLSDLLQSVVAEGTQITFDKMPVVLSTLKNRVKSPILQKILESVNNNDIVMVHVPESIRVPLYLPFILMAQSSTNCKGIVFLNNCEGAMLETEYTCNATKLKVALESCYMALQMFYKRDNVKLQSPQLLRPSVKIYSQMIVSCIDRKHSIKLDQDIFNSVIYLTSKYFIRTVMGCTKFDETTLDSYCLSNCVNPNYISIKQIVSDFEDADFENIATLIKAMSTNKHMLSRLGKLTVTNFTESYINMYDSSMLLALENYPYFVFNVLSVNARTYINRYQMLESIVGDDGKKLYAALISTIC